MVKKSLLLLNSVKSLSSKIDRVLSCFPDPDEMLTMTRSELIAVSFFTSHEIDEWMRLKQNGFIEKETALIEKRKYSVVDIFSPDYPSLLKEISSPPPVLYVNGSVQILNELCVAIVGTRLPTVYGMDMAEKFSLGLAALKCVITSGLARGIDTVSHKAALKAGDTIAVLGSGLCALYPRENKGVAERISENGAVVSEFPLTFPPLKENFPRRNRIISGLSRGVLVIEAPLRSGSLITARYAFEQNREVFALPGRANSPMSKGTHFLIKQGAKLVDSLEDILEELKIHFKNELVFSDFKPEEKILFDVIGEDGVFLEEIIVNSRLRREEAVKILLSLQIKGLVKELRPSYYTKVSI